MQHHRSRAPHPALRSQKPTRGSKSLLPSRPLWRSMFEFPKDSGDAMSDHSMPTRFLFAIAVALAGCASSDTSKLEARVASLEKEVAELRAARQMADRESRTDAAQRAGCTNSIDVNIDPATQFRDVVAFEVGKTDVRSGDRIAITEVRGTRPDFAVGGVYLVRGEYTLASADDASLGFSVTATQSGEGCTHGNSRGSKTITRGSGSFELATPIPYTGYPHVSFYVKGNGSGGVYFGKGEFLQR